MMMQLTKTALIVDDDADAAQVFGLLFERTGYRATIFDSPEKAFDWAHANHPDMALLNYMMPGMNGDELCRRLRALPGWSSVPVVIQTRSEVMLERDPQEFGADAIIATSFSSRSVEKIINVICKSEGGRDERSEKKP